VCIWHCHSPSHFLPIKWFLRLQHSIILQTGILSSCVRHHNQSPAYLLFPSLSWRQFGLNYWWVKKSPFGDPHRNGDTGSGQAAALHLTPRLQTYQHSTSLLLHFRPNSSCTKYQRFTNWELGAWHSRGLRQAFALGGRGHTMAKGSTAGAAGAVQEEPGRHWAAQLFRQPAPAASTEAQRSCCSGCRAATAFLSAPAGANCTPPRPETRVEKQPATTPWPLATVRASQHAVSVPPLFETPNHSKPHWETGRQSWTGQIRPAPPHLSRSHYTETCSGPSASSLSPSSAPAVIRMRPVALLSNKAHRKQETLQDATRRSAQRQSPPKAGDSGGGRGRCWLRPLPPSPPHLGQDRSLQQMDFPQPRTQIRTKTGSRVSGHYSRTRGNAREETQPGRRPGRLSQPW